MTMAAAVLLGVTALVMAVVILRNDLANDPRRVGRAAPEAALPFVALVGLVVWVWASL